MTHPKFAHSFEVISDFPAVLEPLRTLAQNYRWTWNHEARSLFRSVERNLWDQCDHNPAKLLQRLSPERANRLVEDEVFLARMNRCAKELQEYMSGRTWFDDQYPNQRDSTKIAYFCAEFGISEGLPIYSGGLGVLAGDHLKAASDLGLPLVGVGLLYSKGYFRQRLNHDGWQQEFYPIYDYFDFPLQLMRNGNDQPLRVEVEFPDRVVTCQIWKAMVGRVNLFLLDSNVLENDARDQAINDTLYGGDQDMRIRQEMILGIGGMKALQALGITPTVCHMNEGHAAFLSLERIRQFMEASGTDFRVARQVVVSGNVFTTHTPVPAGFDLFTPDLLQRYLNKTIQGVGLPFDMFVKMGRIDRENTAEQFNMAVLAMQNATHVNGVAKLHAHVSRQMFASRWSQFPEDEVPIDAITNGIHTMTWISHEMAALFEEYLGRDWSQHISDPETWKRIDAIPDEELWLVRENLRGELVRFARRRLQMTFESRNFVRPDFNMIGSILDPRILTIGFARRFATYKRATLMLNDRERLKAILNHPERPVQIIIAGKSHPRDDGGKQMIQELVRFINSEGVRTRMVFLEDYDMEVARRLVQGVDIWLNNPRRPMEASGTSGMKVVANGGLNCSILDGWWDEGYDPSLGWAIGDGDDQGDPGHQDWIDSRSLYGLIEQEIAPKFYHRVENGLPSSWIVMIKNSIKALAPFFSTSRMVEDYATKFYMPASEQYRRLSENQSQPAKEALAWRDRVRKAWPDVKVKKVSDDSKGKAPKNGNLKVVATVTLGALSPDEVSVEVVQGRIGPNRELYESETIPMTMVGREDLVTTYELSVNCETSGHRGYIVRIVPKHDLVSVAHELPIVAWEGA